MNIPFSGWIVQTGSASGTIFPSGEQMRDKAVGDARPEQAAFMAAGHARAPGVPASPSVGTDAASARLGERRETF